MTKKTVCSHIISQAQGITLAMPSVTALCTDLKSSFKDYVFALRREINLIMYTLKDVLEKNRLICALILSCVSLMKLF